MRPLILLIFLVGCQANHSLIKPDVEIIPQQRLVSSLPSAFNPPTPLELKEDWGKEMLIANSFANDFDLYRAITSYKRALILIPKNHIERRLEIEFAIIQCYYLGQKYQQVIETFEASDLTSVSTQFPPLKELLIILYDCYIRLEKCEKAERIFRLIEKSNPETAQNLILSDLIIKGDVRELNVLANSSNCQDSLQQFLLDYQNKAKSANKAQFLNAVLPGTGYLYVGQRKAAFTSFIINALFIAAAYEFFDRGYVPAGIITLSLETGWYLGGINGAGLAAKEYNERLYETKAKDYMTCHRLFPVLMFETAF